MTSDFSWKITCIPATTMAAEFTFLCACLKADTISHCRQKTKISIGLFAYILIHAIYFQICSLTSLMIGHCYNWNNGAQKMPFIAKNVWRSLSLWRHHVLGIRKWLAPLLGPAAMCYFYCLFKYDTWIKWEAISISFKLCGSPGLLLIIYSTPEGDSWILTWSGDFFQLYDGSLKKSTLIRLDDEG